MEIIMEKNDIIKISTDDQETILLFKNMSLIVNEIMNYYSY